MNSNDNSLDVADVLSAFFSERLSSNLSAFEKRMPYIFDFFSDYKERRFFLLYDSSGNANIVDSETGSLMYKGNFVSDIISNYESYARSNSISKHYFCFSSGDVCKTNPKHSRVMKNIGDIQCRLLSEAKILGCFNGGSVGEEGLKLVENKGEMPDFINSLIVFSTGAGFDIEKMYLEKDIKNLFILEPSADIFFASLQLVDWVSILEKMEEKGFRIYIGISDRFEDLVNDFSSEAFSSGRHNIAGCYLYNSFYIDGYDKLFEMLCNEIDGRIFLGYGFYDDARLSLAHTYNNFVNKVPCIKSDFSINKKFGQNDYPILIVGNGPSIDKNISFIRDNVDKFFIVSCGSALSTLYNNGICPDIHVDLERTADVTTFIKNSIGEGDSVGKESYLSKIFFVGMSQVHPGAFEIFDHKGQMPKDVELGSLLAYNVLGDKGVRIVGRVAPSCVHLGVTLAVLFGFKDIYLFGVDMGYEDSSYHHSKSSLYEKMNEDTRDRYSYLGKKETEFEKNLGSGVVLSSGFLPAYKRVLEDILYGWNETFSGELNFYNCSYGAKIKHTESLDCLLIKNRGLSLNKKDFLEKLFSSYFSYIPSESDCSSLHDEIVMSFDKVDIMCDWILSKISDPVDTIEGAERIVNIFSYDFHNDIEDVDSWLYSIFDGSFLYCLSAINTILYLPVNESIRIKYFNECMVEMSRFIEDIKSDFRSNAFTPDTESNYNYF